MIKAKLLLQKKLDSLPKSQRRDYLISCINKSHYFHLEEEQEKQLNLSKDSNDIFCKICKNYNFIRDKYSETCQDCGYEREIAPTEKTFEKIEYIKPGSNLVRIEKDSKKITVDLNKINLWLNDTDPQAKDTQKIIDNLEIIFQSKSIELPQNVQNTSIALWYNFTSFYADYKGSMKKLYNKKAILALCVYYGSSIYDYTVSLQQISILFDVNVQTITTTNTLFRELFKNTDYTKYLVLSEKKSCEIQLSPKNKMIFQKVKNDLMTNFSDFSDPLQNKEYAAIVYFITNKVNTVIKYTLKDLEDRCKVSTTSISSLSKSIEKFYKNNPKKFKELL